MSLTPEQKADLLNRFKKRKYEKKSGQFPSQIVPLAESDMDRPLNTFIDRGEYNENTASSPILRTLQKSYNSGDYKKTEKPTTNIALDSCMCENGNVGINPNSKTFGGLPWLDRKYPKL
jgi:hypothetical protein